jgi:hypothetical protein
MSVVTFLKRLNKAQFESALANQDKIAAMLKVVTTNPPGTFARLFNTEANSEFNKARDALNPTGHAGTHR